MSLLFRSFLIFLFAVQLDPGFGPGLPSGSAQAVQLPCESLEAVALRELPENLLLDPLDCLVEMPRLAETGPGLLLPDLRTLPPSDLNIKRFTNGKRELRLSNTIWNSGAGPLELEGRHDSVTLKTRVFQHVLTDEPGVYEDRIVGEFVWHKTHDHWHYEQFSIYELWLLGPDGRPAVLVSSSDKISYCVIDTDIVNRSARGFPSYRQYRGCDQRLQGLSVGWGDTYKSFLDGQSIILSGVSDGFYAVRSIVNPNRSLMESNYNNNTGVTMIEIHGETVRRLEMAAFVAGLCKNQNLPQAGSVPC